MIPAFLATLLFSVSVIAASRSTRLLGPNTANFGRVVVAVLLLAGWAFTVGLGFGGGAFGWFFFSGVIGFGLGDMALFHAFPRLGPRLCSLLINCLAAPFGAVIEWIWLGTGLTLIQLLCGAMILAGVGFALAPEKPSHTGNRGRALGIVFGILAGLGQGLGAVLSRKAYAVASDAGWSVDGGTAAFQRILGGMLIVSVPMLWQLLRRMAKCGAHQRPAVARDAQGRSSGGWWYMPSRVSAAVGSGASGRFAAGWWVVLNGLAGPTVGVAFYQWALRTTPSGLVLAITATTPLAVIPFAYWLEGDRPGPRSLLAAIIAVAGVIGLALAN